MKKCDSCRFCCWSFGISELNKPAMNHCEHECKKGCDIHNKKDYPPSCKWFVCPYLIGENVQRPDKYQNLLKELSGSIGNYVPAIPIGFDSGEVRKIITKTRTIPAFIMIENKWYEVIMPLDRNEDGSWVSTEEIINEWEELYYKHSIECKSKKMMNIIMV